MMSIRLMRRGAKRRPFYRIVVINSRKPRESKYKEIIGYYNPLNEPPDVNIDLDRAKYWLEKGAHASETVQSLLKKASKREILSNNKT